jgi:hypothetical protein
MSTILEWLTGDDLRSDGAADQVVDAVLDDLDLAPELVAGLGDARDVVRGRCADALEKVARYNPEPLIPHLNTLIDVSANDPVPMVRWHLAMLLGHLVGTDADHDQIYKALLAMLEDESVFTVSWTIVSLCILVRHDPAFVQGVLDAIRPLSTHLSKAIQSKVRYALPLLTNPQAQFPKGWIKSPRLQSLG